MQQLGCGDVVEIRRIPTPLPLPQGLALCGGRLIISFRGIPHIYAFDPATAALKPLCDVPDTAWGLAADDARFWAVCGEPPDDGRSIHPFDAAGLSIGAPVRCPEETGSYLAHDGTSLYLSQWYRKRVMRLGPDGSFEHVANARRGICGIAWSAGNLALLNTDDEESTEYHITMIDLAQPQEGGVDVASVPFRARSLVWTGATFMTNHRERGEIVEFAIRRTS